MRRVRPSGAKLEGVSEPAEYWPQYMLSFSDATAVPLEFGMMHYIHE